jgi:putative transposase
VHVSESTLRRVLAEEGLVLPGQPPRKPRPRTPWPDWLQWKPNRVWAYDFTHFSAARGAALAIIDVVSRKWITTLVCAEESSVQVEVAFTTALSAEDLLDAANARATAALREALLNGDRDAVEQLTTGGTVPLLLAISDNGPQMRSHSTREFLAGVAIAQHSAGPTPPEDQAWIETLFGHLKGEWPHLERIRDPGELELVQADYNTVRLHAGIGYVTPNDEHTGRGEGIRQARREGLIGPRRTDQLPSNHNRGTPMITTCPWLGISPPDWFINSDTRQRDQRNTDTAGSRTSRTGQQTDTNHTRHRRGLRHDGLTRRRWACPQRRRSSPVAEALRGAPTGNELRRRSQGRGRDHPTSA